MTLLQAGYKFAVVYFSKSMDADMLYHRVVTKWKTFHTDLEKQEDGKGLKVSIGIGAAGKGWETIYSSYYQSRKAAMFKTAGEPLLVLEWQQIKGLTASRIMSAREQNELLQCIVMGDSRLVQQQFNYLLKSIDDGVFPVNLQDVRQFFMELLVLVKWKMRELDMEIPEELVKGTEIGSPLFDSLEPAALGERMRNYISGITQKCYEMRKQPSGQSILKVARYIESHYNEKLLLEEMANHVYMSASHFSVLFKQHMGKSFSDYILDIRMEKAKQLLEKGYPVNEAAERVGYQDMRHFSKTFKKYYGVNPSEIQGNGTIK
jgi:two-component system response regulator YesN